MVIYYFQGCLLHLSNFPVNMKQQKSSHYEKKKWKKKKGVAFSNPGWVQFLLKQGFWFSINGGLPLKLIISRWKWWYWWFLIHSRSFYTLKQRVKCIENSTCVCIINNIGLVLTVVIKGSLIDEQPQLCSKHNNEVWTWQPWWERYRKSHTNGNETAKRVCDSTTVKCALDYRF